MSSVLFTQPTLPQEPAPAPDGGLDTALCIVCAKRTYPSWHTLAPDANAERIERGTRMHEALGLKVPLEETELGMWYEVRPQPRTLPQFNREDDHGGFWTPLGPVCRYCSGLPGEGEDWRRQEAVVRCWCGWSKRFPYGEDREERNAVRQTASRSLRSHRHHPNHPDPEDREVVTA